VNGQDARELWAAIENLNRGQNAILVGLSEVKAALFERCGDRARRIEALATGMERQEGRVDRLERGQARLFAWAAMAGGAAVLAGQWLLRALAGGR